MPFRITKNIKVAMVLQDGELIFEFRRPTNEERNAYFHEQLEVKATGAEQLNALDEIRIGMYDRFIEDAYVENGVGREGLINEEGEPASPHDITDDIKVRVALQAFDLASLNVKNS